MLQRIRELGVEAGNATVGSSDAKSINTEISALSDEIDRLAKATTFNGVALLTGGTANVTQSSGTATVGMALPTATSVVSAINVTGAKADTFTLTSGTGSLTLTNGTGVSQKVSVADMSGGSETLNFSQLGVSLTLSGPTGGNDTAANIEKDLDQKTVITTAGPTAQSVFQVGANSGETVGVSFDSAKVADLGLTTALADFTTAATGTTAGVNNWASQQTTAVAELLTATDSAISKLNNTASNLGAVQNRLGHTIAAVGVASENLNASESRIKDLDVASEMVNFTKTQILQQAGTAILAQANSAPQSILTLLR
jgi:flagellin